MSKFRRLAIDMAPAHLRPYLVGLKLADDKAWRDVAADGITVDDARAAYDRGEVELVQGRGQDGHSLLYSIPRKHQASRHEGARLGPMQADYGNKPRLDATEAAILSALTEAADKGYPCPTNDELAEAAGLRYAPSAVKAIRRLVAFGAIRVEHVANTRVVTIADTGKSTQRTSVAQPMKGEAA